MNENTHKTIAVTAVMETDLVTYINVPIDTDENAIWEFIRDGNIDGGDMGEAGSGDWRWQYPYTTDFSEHTDDYSKEIKNYD
jgi:hypothetical protein